MILPQDHAPRVPLLFSTILKEGHMVRWQSRGMCVLKITSNVREPRKDKKPDKRLAEPCAKIDLKGLPVPLGDVSEMKMLAAPDLLNQKS